MKKPWAIRLVFRVAIGLLAACSDAPPQPVKSPDDDRDYRHVVLSNGLRALLIHGPGSVSAAAVSVARGSHHEPDAHLGIAHFVEHMLFIGTDKYPVADEFGEFVLKHGGDTNAYTEVDRTTDGLVAESFDQDEGNGTFDIDLSLTEAGKTHVDEIVDLTYAWIDLIRLEPSDVADAYDRLIDPARG